MRKLNKKQVPQVVLLALLSCGLFGFFTYRMLLPSPAAARSQVASNTSMRNSAKKFAADVPMTDVIVPPSVTMRDPFIASIADAGALTAYQQSHPQKPVRNTEAPVKRLSYIPSSGRVSVPDVPSLPNRPDTGPSGSSGTSEFTVTPINNRPIEDETPKWAVTGVLRGNGQAIAILRNGDSRRIVRTGDMIDGQFRLKHVGSNSVTLQHGDKTYDIPLGAADTPKKDATESNKDQGPQTQPISPSFSKPATMDNSTGINIGSQQNAGGNQPAYIKPGKE